MAAATEDPPSPPAEPVGPFIEVRDASMLQQWDLTARIYRRFEDGLLVLERPFTDEENADAEARALEGTRRTNRETLLRRARTAWTTNRAYLDLVAAGTATNADHIAQVTTLTRQMQGVIRLIVGSDLLDATD